MVNSFKRLQKFKKGVRSSRKVSASNIIPRAPRAAAVKANAAIDVELAKAAKRRAYYQAYRAKNADKIAEARRLRNLMTPAERVAADEAKRLEIQQRKDFRATKRQLIADGLLTKAGKVRKRKRGEPKVKTFGPSMPRAIRKQQKAEGIASGYLTKAGKVRKRKGFVKADMGNWAPGTW